MIYKNTKAEWKLKNILSSSEDLNFLQVDEIKKYKKYKK